MTSLLIKGCKYKVCFTLQDLENSSEKVETQFPTSNKKQESDVNADSHGKIKSESKINDKLENVPSTSAVNKPYTFKRSKVNFTMEDLENSSEDDEFVPSSMYL